MSTNTPYGCTLHTTPFTTSPSCTGTYHAHITLVCGAHHPPAGKMSTVRNQHHHLYTSSSGRPVGCMSNA
jgi:hypothetical protein